MPSGWRFWKKTTERLVLADQRRDETGLVAGAAGRLDHVPRLRDVGGVDLEIDLLALEPLQSRDVVAGVVDAHVGALELAMRHAVRVVQPGVRGVVVPGDRAAVIAAHRLGQLDVVVVGVVRAVVHDVDAEVEARVRFVQGARAVLEHALSPRFHDDAS
jgi:hypothetical protein